MNLLVHLMVLLIPILSLISTYLVFIAITMSNPTVYLAQISQFHIVARQTRKLLIAMTLVPVEKINGVLKQQQVQSATVVTMISTLIGMKMITSNMKMALVCTIILHQLYAMELIVRSKLDHAILMAMLGQH